MSLASLIIWLGVLMAPPIPAQVPLIIMSQTQQQESSLPTEVDTLVVGRTVVLSDIKGEILRLEEGGRLVPITSGTSVKPGTRLLVRKGASFSVLGDQLGPENHGDRWVQFK